MRALLPGVCGLTLLLLALAGCETVAQRDLRTARAAQREAILREPPGDYFVGRRYFNSNYNVRSPGHPWREARLVMLNEQQKLAPDREINRLGSDNNHEYRLRGRFSGEVVYEPVSNRFLPEFLLTDYELVNPSIIAPGSDSGPDTTTIAQPD